MIMFSLLEWWYSTGWKTALEHSRKRIVETYRLFSIPILVRTLFSPWKRIVTMPGASIGDHFRAGVDNAISRFIGFWVRFFVLIAAFALLLASSIISLFELLAWPFIPIAIPVLFVWGIVAL